MGAWADTPEKRKNRLAEEDLYAQVAEEISQGVQRQGLWVKALADAKGDDSAAKSLYIKYRVQSIKDDRAMEREAQAMERKAQEEISRNREREQIREDKARHRVDKQKSIEKEKDTLALAVWVFVFILIGGGVLNGLISLAG